MPTLPEMAEEFLRDMPSPTDVALGIDNTLRWIWAQSEETLAQTANSLRKSFFEPPLARDYRRKSPPDLIHVPYSR